ncbi:MAG: DinB family protein [Acidobacteriota bacterium]|nr:DinB family protein [Acidobacteriota bacterium]
MNIKDIYENNDKIHEKTKQLAATLGDRPKVDSADADAWSLAHIFEHIAIVQDGMTKISAKLLTAAKEAGKTSDGTAHLSENFQKKAAEAKELKLAAPEIIHPTGTQTIADSMAKMAETQTNLQNLRPLFETVECSDFKFPHPFMGDLTAHEWLTLIGGHEARHLRQIQKMLDESGV